MRWRKRAGLLCLILSMSGMVGCGTVQGRDSAWTEIEKTESAGQVENDIVGCDEVNDYANAYGTSGDYADAYGTADAGGYLFDYTEYTDRSLTPRMKKYDIRIAYMPAEAAYCTISSEMGTTSETRMSLDQTSEFSYYLPDNIDELLRQVVVDTITVQFYDSHAACIHESELLITYDSASEQFFICDR